MEKADLERRKGNGSAGNLCRCEKRALSGEELGRQGRSGTKNTNPAISIKKSTLSIPVTEIRFSLLRDITQVR
jgi:hypothetical protein